MSKSEHRCRIINHHDEEAYLQLTLNVDDVEPAEGVEPCAVAVLEGLAYVVPLDVEGDMHPMLVLTEANEFPPESDDAPVAKWWREAKPKRSYEALKRLFEVEGIIRAFQQIEAEAQHAYRISLN